MTSSKGFDEAYRTAQSIGCTAMQIFAKSPMQSKGRKVADEESTLALKAKKETGVTHMVIHAGYLLNFSKELKLTDYQSRSLMEDIVNSDMLGGEGAVVHCGKALELAPEVARENFVQNIVAMLEETKGCKSSIILENTAGQGTEIGFRFDDLGAFFKQIRKQTTQKKRIKVCIDTAHTFAGNYDLRKKAGVHDALDQIEHETGLEHIACVHYNDSKKPLFSRVDRHEDIGEGTIGDEGLREFILEMSKRTDSTVPFVLETPQGVSTYEEQLKKIKSWF
ncbi:MAG: deoxyribonuclease IV [Candidatus Vogelbacteria bacterium]|nr:deoxyribonuclease IV [Candidatus Vogelbacteria bacterium]